MPISLFASYEPLSVHLIFKLVSCQLLSLAGMFKLKLLAPVVTQTVPTRYSSAARSAVLQSSCAASNASASPSAKSVTRSSIAPSKEKMRGELRERDSSRSIDTFKLGDRSEVRFEAGSNS